MDLKGLRWSLINFIVQLQSGKYWSSRKRIWVVLYHAYSDVKLLILPWWIHQYMSNIEIHSELSRKNYDMVFLTNNSMGPRTIQALVPEIKKKYPHIKIIVLSGYSTPEFVRDLKEQGIDGFLSLPFSRDDLVQKVTSIFDEERL